MAIFLDTDLQITVKGIYSAQTTEAVWSYKVSAAPALVGVTAPQLGEAWWNHVKALYRSIYPVGFGTVLLSVETRVVNNPAGDFGEYDIPLGEQVGTRANPTQNEPMPSFATAGVRMTVATRATRPGAKRFSCLAEGDQNGGTLASSIITPLNTFMAFMTLPIGPLGAPAALFTLQPKVFRLGSGESVIASQDIVGHLINPYVTTQVSRKIGHGV